MLEEVTSTFPASNTGEELAGKIVNITFRRERLCGAARRRCRYFLKLGHSVQEVRELAEALMASAEWQLSGGAVPETSLKSPNEDNAEKNIERAPLKKIL